jgi:hypothetical protein
MTALLNWLFGYPLPRHEEITLRMKRSITNTIYLEPEVWEALKFLYEISLPKQIP